MKRTDERDIIFSRMNYKPGTPQYEDYYLRNPDKKEIDDELRDRPDILFNESPTFDEILSPLAEANFKVIEELRRFCEGQPVETKKDLNPAEISEILKNMTVHYGAADAAVMNLTDDDYYSHRGRQMDSYGDEVNTSLKNAVIFLVPMDTGAINTAPAAPQMIETSNAYIKAAVIGLQISYYIRKLGYNARNHMDGNYLLPLVPAAVKAGLGERGRHSLLISRANGAFVRIGAVTTDMTLIADTPKPFEVERFCKICRRCIKTCPAQTISDSQKPEEWRISQEACYGRWRHLGTDCGICISTCPLGQDLDVGEIAKMSNKDIYSFIDEYNQKFGYRKRTSGRYFD